MYRAGTFKRQGINFQCIITCRHTACIYNYILKKSTKIFVTVSIQLSIFNSVKNWFIYPQEDGLKKMNIICLSI